MRLRDALRPARARPGAGSARASVRRPKTRTPWREARWLAVDLELTGLTPGRDEIIAVGAVPIEAGRAQLGAAFYSLARSARRSDQQAVLTHKLLAADLADAPPLEEVLARLAELLAGRVPVFHTAWVERTFLGSELARRGTKLPAAADTEVLGRLWLSRARGAAPARLSLSQLADTLGQSAEVAHHALGDALTTAHAFISLAALLERGQRQTVGTLVRAEHLLNGARRT
jgi:DNA polymerase III subunit epsilon